MTEQTFIDKYFQDPNNAVNESIFVQGRKVTPQEFYGMIEPQQENVFILMKRIECADGFSMSVQANHSAYCSPRMTFRSIHTNIYEDFEVGFPSEKEDLLMPYAEDPERPTETVYAYVPKDIINQIIAKHNSTPSISASGEGNNN